MKSEKGITLSSLLIYVIAMTIVVGVVATILSFYNNNIVGMNNTGEINLELNKFEAKMIQETKEIENQVVAVEEDSIEFSNGHIYSFESNCIYQNSILICSYVKDFEARIEQDGVKQILKIYILIRKGQTEVSRNLSYAIDINNNNYQVTTSTKINDYTRKTGVYGSLYKINDNEYHLIFNTDGALAQGYTEQQLVGTSPDISNGSSRNTSITDANGNYVSNQIWGEYSDLIKKLKIEEKINPTRMSNYFRGLTQITEIEGIQYIDTKEVISMDNAFISCSSLQNIDLSNFNTSKVTNMEQMFFECGGLTSLDLSSFDTSNVVSMGWMFYNCGNLTSLNINSFNTSKVTRMSEMFYYCQNLTNLDISNFNTTKVTAMGALFADCHNLKTIYVGDNWTTMLVTNNDNMFKNCTNLVGAISYDSTKRNTTYANYTTGYLTYKPKTLNDYQKLAYIESTGTQYILTNVIPAMNYKIVADVYSTYTGELCFIGVTDESTNKCIDCYFYNGNPRFYIDNGTSHGALFDRDISANDKKIHWEAINSDSGMRFETSVSDSMSNSFLYGEGTNVTPFMIFALNSKGTPNYKFRGRIYTLKIYDNNTLIADFVPCKIKANGEVGMYDAVTMKFYCNLGTGDFIPGPNV